MFHYASGLRLTSIDLAVDVRTRQTRGFISHAHMDHMAPHELIFCTPATARLVQHRLGQRLIHELPFGEPLDWDGVRLTTFPAGHILGSAMLLAEEGGTSLLYTGDFKLGASATAEPAEPPHADVLVMETTFGKPQYRMPPREQVVGELIAAVKQALEFGITPVVQAYVIGKSQEVTRLLFEHGVPVSQHPLIHAASRVYEACGCALGDYQLLQDEVPFGHAVIVPPRGQKAATVRLPPRCVTIAVTGWAVDERARFRLGVDYAFPLSDHADYDELFACVDRVAPKVIYCTHGPVEFVERLRERGHNAHPLASTKPLRLF